MPPQLLATSNAACADPEGVEPKARPEGVAHAPPSFLLGASVADGASAGDAGSGASAGGGASAGDAGGGGGRSRKRTSGRARQRARARATAGHGGKGKGKVAQPGHGGITSEASITSSAASPPALDGGITSSAASPALDGGITSSATSSSSGPHSRGNCVVIKDAIAFIWSSCSLSFGCGVSRQHGGARQS